LHIYLLTLGNAEYLFATSVQKSLDSHEKGGQIYILTAFFDDMRTKKMGRRFFYPSRSSKI